MQVTIKQQAAEIDRLKSLKDLAVGQAETLVKLRDALQAKLAAMGNTKPVAWMDEYGNPFPLSAHKGKWYGHGERNWKPLYTAPKVAQPLSTERFKAITNSLSRQQGWDGDGWDLALKEAIEAAHGIGGQQP